MGWSVPSAVIVSESGPDVILYLFWPKSSILSCSPANLLFAVSSFQWPTNGSLAADSKAADSAANASVEKPRMVIPFTPREIVPPTVKDGAPEFRRLSRQCSSRLGRGCDGWGV